MARLGSRTGGPHFSIKQYLSCWLVLSVALSFYVSLLSIEIVTFFERSNIQLSTYVNFLFMCWSQNGCYSRPILGDVGNNGIDLLSIHIFEERLWDVKI